MHSVQEGPAQPPLTKEQRWRGYAALAAVVTVVVAIVSFVINHLVVLPKQERTLQERALLNSLPADAQSLAGSLRMPTWEERIEATGALNVPNEAAFAHIYVPKGDFRTVATRTPLFIFVPKESNARWMGGPLGMAMVYFETAEPRQGVLHYDYLCQLTRWGHASIEHCLDPAQRQPAPDQAAMASHLRPATPTDLKPYVHGEGPDRFVATSNVRIFPSSSFEDRIYIFFPASDSGRPQVLGGELGLSVIVPNPGSRNLTDDLCIEFSHGGFKGEEPEVASKLGPDIVARYRQLCPRRS